MLVYHLVYDDDLMVPTVESPSQRLQFEILKLPVLNSHMGLNPLSVQMSSHRHAGSDIRRDQLRHHDGLENVPNSTHQLLTNILKMFE